MMTARTDNFTDPLLTLTENDFETGSYQGMRFITRYIGTNENVAIPAAINGEPVIRIEDYAFKDCRTLVSVAIPDGVTLIGHNSFFGCDKLASINIPKSVTVIGKNAFNGCRNLRSIIIPEGVDEVQSGTFYNCKNLASVTIPDSLVEIGDEAFWFCESLVSINIPYGVDRIGRDAFLGCTDLEHIDLPNSIIEIGYSAFQLCLGITDITIPESVEVIDKGAFSNCFNLKTISVDSESKSFSDIDGVLLNKDGSVLLLYPEGRNSKTYTIPKSVTRIGYGAFECNASLTDIDIPTTVFSIDKCAFSICNLRCVNISSGVLIIGAQAFSSCEKLNEIVVCPHNARFTDLDGVLFDKSKAVLIQYPAGKNQRGYIVPSGVVEICEYAFSACKRLTSVIIPPSVKHIGRRAFDGCKNLATITILSEKRMIDFDSNSFPKHTTVNFFGANTLLTPMCDWDS